MKTKAEQLDLIKSCVVQNANYDPKKHHVNEIVDLVFEKASLFLNSISNENTLKKYILKVTNEVLSKYCVANNIANIVEQQDVFIEKSLENKKPSNKIYFAEEKLEEITKKLEEVAEKKPIKELEFYTPSENEQEIEFENSFDISTFKDIETIQNNPIVEEFEENILHIEDIPQIEDYSENYKKSGLQNTPEIEPVFETEHLIPTVPQENAYRDIIDPIEKVKTKKISKELTDKIIDIVLMAQKNEAEKQYSKIFYLKYVKKMKQSEIARQLNISEEELCARYLKLVRIVKKELK